MAFKMNKSPHKTGGIKGTRAHKKSVIRATQFGTEVPRTKADTGLIEQAYRLGQSMRGTRGDYDIDYELDFDFPDLTEEEEVEGCTYENATNYNPDATIDDGSCEYPEEEDDPTTPPDDNNDDDGGGDDIVSFIGPSDGGAANSFNTVYGDDPLYAEIGDTSELHAGQVDDLMDSLRFSSGQGVEVLSDTQRANIRKDFENMTFLERKDLLKDLQGSAMQKRDDRIYKNARPGSVLRKNMRKSGYTPPHLR
jgi:hypothetical protein